MLYMYQCYMYMSTFLCRSPMKTDFILSPVHGCGQWFFIAWHWNTTNQVWGWTNNFYYDYFLYGKLILHVILDSTRKVVFRVNVERINMFPDRFTNSMIIYVWGPSVAGQDSAVSGFSLCYHSWSLRCIWGKTKNFVCVCCIHVPSH